MDGKENRKCCKDLSSFNLLKRFSFLCVCKVGALTMLLFSYIMYALGCILCNSFFNKIRLGFLKTIPAQILRSSAHTFSQSALSKRHYRVSQWLSEYSEWAVSLSHSVIWLAAVSRLSFFEKISKHRSAAVGANGNSALIGIIWSEYQLNTAGLALLAIC